jgi:hypothetical protein
MATYTHPVVFRTTSHRDIGHLSPDCPNLKHAKHVLCVDARANPQLFTCRTCQVIYGPDGFVYEADFDTGMQLGSARMIDFMAEAEAIIDVVVYDPTGEHTADARKDAIGAAEWQRWLEAADRLGIPMPE